MAIAERLGQKPQTPGLPVVSVKPPGEITERMARGRARMRDGATARSLPLKFWRGDQYVYRGNDGLIVNQNTITLPDGRGKPRWRVRQVRNLFIDIVAHEVSAATQRVPGYEINPSTSDPEDIAAARLGARVARYGYDKWRLRNVTTQVVTYAVVADEGFAWPFWDSSVGPYFSAISEDGEEITVGEGEVGVRIFGPNEVYWEPGLKFDESRWHAVEQARSLESVYDMEGYLGGKLEPDAAHDEDGVERNRTNQHSKLVMVTEYLERPSPKFPDGRWLTIANKKVIVAERPFPCQDGEGKVIDEPVLHKLSYFTDPDADRDMGLGRHLVDPMRTINDCINKMLEWKNLAMNPQVIIRNGEFKQQLTDEPGAVYHAVGSGEVEWRPVPPLPGALNEIKSDAIADMARIAAQNDIPSQVESGRGIQALVEKDANRRASFIADLAEWHSRLMRHCLYLVQRHYTEPRLLQVRGRSGPDPIHDFLGAQLRGQADVTVLPGSITPRTKEAIETRIIAFADRGWISPEAAMAAINGGTAESLVESYELDVGRANQIIQKIKDGTFLATPPRPVFAGEDPGWEVEPVLGPPEPVIDPMTGQPAIDPMTGQPQMGEPTVIQPGIPATSMPGWMPRPFDNVKVHQDVISDWLKTPDFEGLDPEQMQAANAYYAALLDIEAREAQRQAEMQNQEAMQLGMQNAARPQDKGMPSQPGGDGGPRGMDAEAQVFGARYQAGSTTSF